MALRYSVKRTELANSNIGLFICDVNRMLAFMLSSTNVHLSSGNYHNTFSLDNHMISIKMTKDKSCCR